MTEPCPRCGQTHPRCHAHNRAGGPCMRHPRDGATVCPAHGGAAPQVQQAAAERRDQAAAELELRRGLAAAYGSQVPDVDPATAMLDAIRWKHAEVIWLRSKVAELDEDDLTWGTTAEVDKRSGEFPGTDTTREAKPNAWLALLRTAEDQLVRFSKAAHDAGIDERRIALAEGQAQLVVGAISQILTAMLNSLVTVLADVQDAVDVIEQVWPELTAQHVPAVLRALDTEGD